MVRALPRRPRTFRPTLAAGRDRERGDRPGGARKPEGEERRSGVGDDGVAHPGAAACLTAAASFSGGRRTTRRGAFPAEEAAPRATGRRRYPGSERP